MLTDEEEKYLEKIPASKKVKVSPYDQKTPEIVEEFVQKIKSVEPAMTIKFIGASALKISGQGDIDLLILCPEKDFEDKVKSLKSVLGEPIRGLTTIVWRFERSGHEVEIYLTDPSFPTTAQQLKTQEILENSPDLVKEYEKLKESSAGLSYREYQRKKYEFYNRIFK